MCISDISLDKTDITVVSGENYTLTATVLPANATNKTVTWRSSNTAIATVDNGKVTAVGAGTATITARTVDLDANCNALYASCTVTVPNVEVTNIVILRFLLVNDTSVTMNNTPW